MEPAMTERVQRMIDAEAAERFAPGAVPQLVLLPTRSPASGHESPASPSRRQAWTGPRGTSCKAGSTSR